MAAGKRFYIESSENEKALVIDRGEFDRMAAQSAQEAGVRLKEGCHVAQGEYEANCIIGADGPNSSVARHFGFSKIREYVICAQADYEFDCEDRHKVQAYLSPSRFPGFFGWAIPNGDGTAKIGMGGRLPCDIKKRFEAFTGELGLGGKKPEKYMSAIIPISMREKTGMESSGKKVLLAGDAAGQVKATTGGGIFFGSQCGRLAGKNCENPAGYEIAWRAKYGADLQLHRHIYNSMHTLGHAGHEAFFLGAKALGAEKFLSRYGQMDLITKSFNMETVLNYIVGGNAAAQG
ncbi:hypothetical protein FJZ26_03150 [Candidatus Parvarchaeota archaeon]|nr:hypothetical protein [Candidatus Parvarchaeota archaeon]